MKSGIIFLIRLTQGEWQNWIAVNTLESENDINKGEESESKKSNGGESEKNGDSIPQCYTRRLGRLEFSCKKKLEQQNLRTKIFLEYSGLVGNIYQPKD